MSLRTALVAEPGVCRRVVVVVVVVVVVIILFVGGSEGDTLRGINPRTWVVSPGRAPLAGCRCHPVLRDDMPHDALMWGHGEDLVDRSRP